MNYPIYAHQDVLAVIEERGGLSRRLNLVSSHLAAHGRTSVVKGCKDPVNRGWLRTPVAGNNRYLWWVRHSSGPADGAGFPDGAIVLRAVRHHDDHAPLQVGEFAQDYAPITLTDLEDEAFIEQPWTPAQNDFIRSEASVRILIGNPGSGKTTALWRAVMASGGRNVLYLTWSDRLASKAKEHFDCFCGDNVHVTTRSIRNFWGTLLRRDVPFVSPSDGLRLFAKTLRNINPTISGDWRKFEKCLHAEARAVVYGMAMSVPESDATSCLTQADYLKIRKGELGPIAEKVPRIVSEIGAVLKEELWIPELVAAADVIRCLENSGVPESLADFDTIVVDEVQDLTRLELRALLKFHAFITGARGEAPRLFLAGDEGQTVVPTHFKWGGLKDMVEEALSELNPGRNHGDGVEETQLDSNLRCPRNVREVLDRASELYVKLRKQERPGNQAPPSEGDLHDARLLLTECTSEEEACILLAKLMEQPDLAVISLDSKFKKTIAKCTNGKEVIQRILSPDEAKGLEFQSVCLINPGSHLKSFDDSIKKTMELDDLAARTSLDQFRVAVSRATGDLVFLDVKSNPPSLELSRKMLGKPIEMNSEGLEEFFKENDSQPEDRVRSQLEAARAIADQDIRRGWSIACAAFRMLGDFSLTNGVADLSLRAEVGQEILAQAALLLARTEDKSDEYAQVHEIVSEAAAESGLDNSEKLFDAFKNWIQLGINTHHVSSSKRAVELLVCVASAGPSADWLRPSIRAVAQRLRTDMNAAANCKNAAHHFTSDVAQWHEITGEIGDTTKMVIELRTKAYETLVGAKNLMAAEAILALVPDDPRLNGMLHEAHGRHREAALCFETVQDYDAALRNWRADGKWENALTHASGEDAMKLKWLADLESLAVVCPEGLGSWMQKAETKRMGDIINGLAKNARQTLGKL
jgi:AraC-like DNA-binding protein